MGVKCFATEPKFDNAVRENMLSIQITSKHTCIKDPEGQGFQYKDI